MPFNYSTWAQSWQPGHEAWDRSWGRGVACAVVDRVSFPLGGVMNTQITTTGLVPLCLGSQETFELRPILGGLPWLLQGGTVTLSLADPQGNVTVIAATVGAYNALAPWTVAGLVGGWTRAWTVTDSTGLKQVSRPIAFDVLSSPV